MTRPRKPLKPPKPTKADLEKRVSELEKQMRWLIFRTQQMTPSEARKAMA